MALTLSRGCAIGLSIWLTLNPLSAVAAPADPKTEDTRGALSVSTDPVGASVYVDGTFAGETPLTLTRIALGDHRVRVVKAGYLENARVINVAKGQPKSVAIALTRLAGAAAANAQNTPAQNQNAQEETAAENGGLFGFLHSKWFWIPVAAGGGTTTALILTHNGAPKAGTVSVTPTGTGMANQTSFLFTSQGATDPDSDPLTYTWDFGDGTTGTGNPVAHTYVNVGTFTPKLTIKDDHSHSTTTTASAVVVATSVDGTWSGGRDAGFGCGVTVALTQTGGTLSGTMTLTSPCAGSVPLAIGTVTALTHPAVVSWSTQSFDFSSATGAVLGATITFTGTTTTNGTSMAGTLTTAQKALGVSFQAPATFTK